MKAGLVYLKRIMKKQWIRKMWHINFINMINDYRRPTLGQNDIKKPQRNKSIPNLLYSRHVSIL